MPHLSDLKPSITELPQDEALALVTEIQASRLRSKPKLKKPKAAAGKMHGLFFKTGRLWVTLCKKERDCGAKAPRITEDETLITCKGCLKVKEKAL